MIGRANIVMVEESYVQEIEEFGYFRLHVSEIMQLLSFCWLLICLDILTSKFIPSNWWDLSLSKVEFFFFKHHSVWVASLSWL